MVAVADCVVVAVADRVAVPVSDCVVVAVAVTLCDGDGLHDGVSVTVGDSVTDADCDLCCRPPCCLFLRRGEDLEGVGVLGRDSVAVDVRVAVAVAEPVAVADADLLGDRVRGCDADAKPLAVLVAEAEAEAEAEAVAVPVAVPVAEAVAVAEAVLEADRVLDRDADALEVAVVVCVAVAVAAVVAVIDRRFTLRLDRPWRPLSDHLSPAAEGAGVTVVDVVGDSDRDRDADGDAEAEGDVDSDGDGDSDSDSDGERDGEAVREGAGETDDRAPLPSMPCAGRTVVNSRPSSAAAKVPSRKGAL